MTVLHAFFSLTAQAETGNGFWVTVGGERIRATHVDKERDPSKWGVGRTYIDGYGREVPPPPVPDDLVYVGEVRGDSHEFDVDHLDPNLTGNWASLREDYTKKYGRHDYTGPVPRE